MKKISLHTFILIILTSVIGLLSIFQVRNVRKAQKITATLAVQVDSLALISARYQRIHHTYTQIYHSLVVSQDQISALHQELTRRSAAQQADAVQIQQELRDLTSIYDTLRSIPTSDKANTPNPFQP